MAELCVDFDGQEFCSSGEVLIVAVIIECLFYLFLFIGGWELIRRWRAKKAHARRVRLERESQQWIPFKK